MSTQPTSKPLIIRWATVKGLAALLLFIAITALIEYSVVLYAVSLGVTDASTLQWTIQFPGSNWQTQLTISPLFHMVPIVVIVALTFSWTYLTSRLAVRRKEARRIRAEPKSGRTTPARGLSQKLSRPVRSFFRKAKSGLLRIRAVSYVWQRIHFARATIESGGIVLLAFIVFTFVFAFLAYPQLIHQTVTNAYRDDPSLRTFVEGLNGWVKGVGETLGPIGWIGSAVNNALISAAPSVRAVGVGLGAFFSPLAELNGQGKYLVFQNVAVMLCGVAILLYGELGRSSHRYSRK